MHKRDWTDLARAFRALRDSVEAKWPPNGNRGYMFNAADIHDRKLIWHAELDMLDRAARLLAAELKARASRFNERRFLELAGVEYPR